MLNNITIEKLIDIINVYNVKVEYDSPEQVTLNIKQGEPVIYFSCMGEKDKKRYESLKDKSRYISSSPSIHIPKLTIEEIVDIFECDATGIHDFTLKSIEPYVRHDIPQNITYICFLFLHEVGHWMQFKNLDFKVHNYMNQDYNERIENNKAFQSIYNDIAERRAKECNISDIYSCNLTFNEKKRLQQRHKEYRKIPTEKDADDFAVKNLEILLDNLKNYEISL